MLFDDVIEAYRKEMPLTFVGTSLDERTGHAVRWRTVQNKRSRGEIPPHCFMRSGTGPTIVIRYPFLDYWKTTLRDARQAFGKPTRTNPPVPRAGRRRSRAASDAAAEPTALSAAPPE
jgi:hypothetical protein